MAEITASSHFLFINSDTSISMSKRRFLLRLSSRKTIGFNVARFD